MWSFKTNMSKYQKVGVLICTLAVILYVLTFAMEAYQGPETIKVKELSERRRFCNGSVHFLLPDDTIIDEMDTDTLYDVFSRYVTRQQIRCCNISRAGSLDTFGKNICLDYFQKVRGSCLVYSFGSEFHFEFENSIWKDFKCEIHTFDPSHSTNGVQIPKGVNFHLIGLSDNDITIPAPESLKDFTTWQMKRLSSVRRSLRHEKRYIDILKIDIEGFEWKVLPDVIQSRDLRYVRQICLEIHFGFSFKHVWSGNRVVDYRYTNSTWGNVTIANQLKVLRNLYDNGFRIFKSEPIAGWGMYHIQKPKKSINTLIEISLVNIYN
ncbi:probable methyltransferase-like protein 24 [Ruditapes philippinarum]|uniref:probable methyltransferase-like protein 24 n=1 Tax=Ruditapes philippinarum TaxID=129788 RepID=UPI00295B8C38|nr:probable methyltransferase-like protein 24 [Ruditapes philippinarum]